MFPRNRLMLLIAAVFMVAGVAVGRGGRSAAGGDVGCERPVVD